MYLFYFLVDIYITSISFQDYAYQTLILGNETSDAATDGVYHIVPGDYVPVSGIYYVGLRPYDPGETIEHGIPMAKIVYYK